MLDELRRVEVACRPGNEKSSSKTGKQGYNPGWALSRVRGPTRPPAAGTGFKSDPRWPMSPLVGLAILWGVITAVLIILLIYRSTLTMQEDDQLYLSDSESHMQKEQTEILTKVNKINPMLRWLGASSAVLALVVVGMYTYQMLNTTQ